MRKTRILVVEDDENTQELIKYNLNKDGFDVFLASSGEEALHAVSDKLPDIILLDIMLPGINGLEVCKRLKADKPTRDVPVIIITAKGEESDIVAGLELGADDYVVKPFGVKVLVARLRAVLRRTADSSPLAGEELVFGRLTIHAGKHIVDVDRKEIPLTFSEFAVLYFLASKPGWVFTRGQIVSAVRTDNYPVTERSVDVIIVGVRKKLGICGSCIETVRGVGYKFRDTAECGHDFGKLNR